jgi:hypothetical protein
LPRFRFGIFDLERFFLRCGEMRAENQTVIANGLSIGKTKANRIVKQDESRRSFYKV